MVHGCCGNEMGVWHQGWGADATAGASFIDIEVNFDNFLVERFSLKVENFFSEGLLHIKEPVVVIWWSFSANFPLYKASYFFNSCSYC